MFTGIVKEIGFVQILKSSGSSYRLLVSSGEIYKTASIGDSVAVNGVCLTLVEKKGGALAFDIVEETIRKSNLKSLKAKDPVNLEGALKASEALSGHFVLGHVDCVVKIKNRNPDEAVIEFEIPDAYSCLVVEKGSIAVDGVSLTIGAVKGSAVKIYIIPHTLKATTLGLKKAPDELNIEFDILGKYAARFNQAALPSGVTEDFLKKKGFI